MASPIRTAVSTHMLRASTRKFFSLHWSKDTECEIPRWTRLDQANIAESVNQGGCYAILDGSGNVSYIGLGIAKSLREGTAGGVLGRLYRHVLVRGSLSIGELKPKREMWREMTGILYVPFRTQGYLAAALEIYLLDKFGAALHHNKSRIRRE